MGKPIRDPKWKSTVDQEVHLGDSSGWLEDDYNGQRFLLSTISTENSVKGSFQQPILHGKQKKVEKRLKVSLQNIPNTSNFLACPGLGWIIGHVEIRKGLFSQEEQVICQLFGVFASRCAKRELLRDLLWRGGLEEGHHLFKGHLETSKELQIETHQEW